MEPSVTFELQQHGNRADELDSSSKQLASLAFAECNAMNTNNSLARLVAMLNAGTSYMRLLCYAFDRSADEQRTVGRGLCVHVCRRTSAVKSEGLEEA